MFSAVAEVKYPVTFRKADTARLSDFLNRRDSVDLIGMRRVGISNFLRFFLYNPAVAKTYLEGQYKHILIPIDLNDLIERELYPFWMLTFKRIVDAVATADVTERLKQNVEALFVNSMQQTEPFLLSDNIRKALVAISQEQLYPTLFLLRFDRIHGVINPTFFDNLQGLRDATNQQLSYVFTSFRSIEELSPSVFSKAASAVFFQKMFISPASDEDLQILYSTQKKRYNIVKSLGTERELFRLVGGSAQYLQLSLIILNERKEVVAPEALNTVLMHDERIQLHSEELWESITKVEQNVLRSIAAKKKIAEKERKLASYLWDSGMLTAKDQIFSSLLEQYIIGLTVRETPDVVVHFSKKEHKLFTYLSTHLQQVCERDAIIAVVWPEYSEFGISDWAIDRLVARVRVKLKQQGSSYEIKTIRTRGYQMIEKQ